MKKIRTVLLLVLVLVLAGCQARKLKDIQVTSARIVSVVPEGLTGLTALVELGVHNPSSTLEITDFIGLARFAGADALSITADQLIVEGRTDKLYQIPLQAQVIEGFSPFRLLSLLGSNTSLDDVTISFRCRVALRGGIGKNIEMEDIPLSELINYLEAHEDEV